MKAEEQPETLDGLFCFHPSSFILHPFCMRQRNHLLALALLGLFAALGVWYFRAFVQPRKPFGIVLFVGEGLVTSKLAAARLYDGGADHRLAIDSLGHVALLGTSAADFAVPDSAAAASALACGVKVNHHALCIDSKGQTIIPLLRTAAAHGRWTGLVTNGCLTDPTPAAFYANATDCRDRPALAAQLFGSPAPLQVVLGGGAGDFLPASASGRRADERDLVTPAVKDAGYVPLHTAADLQAIQPWRGQRLLGLFASDAFPFRDQVPAGNTPAAPSLSEMVAAAIASLQRHRAGYLLVVDAGLIERASLENQGERALQELLELDRAVAVALRYAGPQSLVLVAGGPATGGLALNGYPLRTERGVSLVGGINAYGFPSLTGATGPAGPVPNAPPPMAPAAYFSPYAANVADDAVAAGAGPGSEGLQGFKENTAVYDLIRAQL